MNRNITQRQRANRSRALHAVIFMIAMMSFALHGVNVRAATLKATDYRVVAASHKFKDTWQFAAAFKLRPPRRLYARHLELAIGTVSAPSETRPFLSLGPVWRLPLVDERLFVDLGISPTLIAGSTLNGRDLGGNFHFTSSASLGASFGAREAFTLSLRIQHTSNGGLSGTNPGLDMIGLSFTFDFNQ